mgnify:CR=1 FL=1
MLNQPISIEGVFMKKTTHILFTIYIFLVIWIILFKLPHFRSINLIPFYYPNKTGFQIREVLDNLIIFIPFGLYLKTLNINSERTVFLGFLLSLSLELSQYIFCIGASDITDLIGNTLGSGVGAVLFAFLGKIFPKKRMSMINGIGAVVEVVGIALLSMLFVTNK